MSRVAARSDALARGILAAVVGIDLLSFFPILEEAHARALTEGAALSWFAELLARPAANMPVIAIGVAGAVIFGRRPARLRAGLVSLGALALLSTAHAELFGSPWRHLYYSGLCLCGWLLGLAVSRWGGASADESYARIGATALLGAAYLNGGLSKLAFGGAEWSLGLPIQVIVIAQDGMVADTFASAYRSWVVTTPALAAFFAFATVIVELAAPLMIVSHPLRIVVALGLLAMHLNILVLTHILYWEAMVFLVVFGVLPRERSSDAAELSSLALLRGRPFAVGAAVLIVCASIGIVHQSRRFATWYDVEAPQEVPLEASNPIPPSSAETETVAAPSELRQVGPFSIGEAMTDGWSVDTLELTSDGFVMMLVGEPGRVRFEVTCASSPHRSPFDLGPVHVFFSNNVATKEVDEVGREIQARLRNVGEERVLCDEVRRWRAAAEMR